MFRMDVNNTLKSLGIKDIKKNLTKQITYFTTMKNLAEQFIKIQPIFYDRSKTFWFWDFKEMGWNIIDETDLLNIISESSPANTIASRERNEILEALKQVGRLCEPKKIKETWIQFKGTIFDVETGETFKATPEYFSTNPIPWEVGSSEETPVIDKLFKDWVGEEYLKTLQEIAAYCMLPDYPIHRIFCFLGTGRNGKSKYLSFIDKLIGRDNTCSCELDNLVTSRFESYSLYKKLVCLMGETNFNTMKRTSILKKLSGQDLFPFESKGKNSVKDVNYAKLLISTNNLPETTDKTDGWYRRWVLIDFPNQFPEGKNILKTIPEKEYNNFCKKSLKIIKEIFERGSFTNEGSIEVRRERYENKSNPFDKFIKETCVIDPDSHIVKTDFKKQFSEWCVANRFMKPTDVSIKKKIDGLDSVTQKKVKADWYRADGSSVQVNAWSGIAWRNKTLEPTFVQEILKEEKPKKVEEINMNELL